MYISPAEDRDITSIRSALGVAIATVATVGSVSSSHNCTEMASRLLQPSNNGESVAKVLLASLLLSS